MYAILGLGLTAFLLCLIATPLCRDLFLRLNIVDHPDADRKFHLKPIPRIGGIPIVLSYAGALGLMIAFAPHGARISIQHSRLLWSLLPAAAVIFTTGLLDDLVGLKPKQKLAGQLLAAALAVGLGAHLSIAHGILASPWLSIPLSLLWLIGCSNAFNLIDGLDGLASGVGLFAVGSTLLAAILHGNMGLALATIPLCGCLLAFLRYNFSPASIFLGDCGSLTIGFMLGCFGLIWSQNSGTFVGMAAPLMALALPLVDVALSIGRRFLRSVPIFDGDRGHIHHMVLARGFKPRDTALILYGVCGIAAFLSLLESFARYQLRGLTLIVFCSLVFTGVNYLGYVELSAARRTLSRKTILRVVKEEIYLQELELSFASANTPDECWKIIRAACEDMHFASAEMYLQGESYAEKFLALETEPSWKMNLIMGRSSYLTLTRISERRPPKLMTPVLDLIQETIREKEEDLVKSAAPIRPRVISGAA
ncbi:MAG: hypothetical protein NVSMB3_01550 [Acidobacteriaceae bacterium]